ncbi:MAG TPA: hypothetical protein VN772_01945 [Solirubrobacteraceae bacterium]|nr:hypothetical protein [Solirubrobacteraceae bacterium]
MSAPHVPSRLLLAGESFGPSLGCERVLAALDHGLQAGGLPAADLCALDPGAEREGDVAGMLATLHFDARLRRARALVLAARRLAPDLLVGAVTFEIATRARQAGVPAFAVARESSLGSFEARILDLQAVIVAPSARSLLAAGRRLADII